MTDSAVVFGSGQANRLGGSVIENIKSGQDDFDTHNPEEDAPLTVPADEAGEIADTDNYRELTERSIMQELEEALAETNVEVPVELVEEQQAAVEQLRLIPMLREYQSRFAKRGIGIPDIVTIENHCPGLLLKNAPEAYSYKPTHINLEYSQEAIGERIGSILRGGKKVLDKIIAWLLAQCKKIRSVFTKERFKAAAVKVEQVEQVVNRSPLTIHEVLDRLDNPYEYDKHPVVLKVGEILDMGIRLEMFTSLSKPNLGVSWVAHIQRHVGKKPQPLMQPHQAKDALGKLSESIKWMDELVEANGASGGLRRASEEEDTMGVWLNSYSHSLDIRRVYASARSGELVTDITRDIVALESMVEKFKRRDNLPDRMDGNQGEALEKTAQDVVDFMSDILALFRDSLSNSLALLTWTTFSINFLNPQYIEHIERIRKESD